ncbi:MAG: sigma-70 family RNA polymerase sigma factor [Desulfamplus sp.]|nr:sigma-70 family RNA polymerase sigma factor [Desulfamplus sp.]
MKPDEKELIQDLMQGGDEAFELLVETYQKRLIAIACAITLDKEESLEIVQDVFLSVYQNIGTFREDSGLFTWMRKITVNLCLNWKRKWIRRFKWYHQPLESDDSMSYAEYDKKTDSPESEYMEYESEQKIMEKIEQLPEKIRSVLVLKAFEQMSYEEIAQTLEINIGTVKSRLHYARKFLAHSGA